MQWVNMDSPEDEIYSQIYYVCAHVAAYLFALRCVRSPSLGNPASPFSLPNGVRSRCRAHGRSTRCDLVLLVLPTFMSVPEPCLRRDVHVALHSLA